MWIATKVGFFSIVRKEEKDFHVRARLRPDLVEMMDLAGIESEIFESEYADYRFRIVVDSNTVRKIGAVLFKEIDYDNFKNTIHDSSTQSEKYEAYGNIWSVMWALQENESI